MSDHHHWVPTENRYRHPHAQEFHSLLNPSTTESPSTTASPISPMTTMVHQNQTWPLSSQEMDQQQYYYDMNQQQQQQHQYPQQQQQQHPYEYQYQNHLQDQYWPPGPTFVQLNQAQQHQFQHYYPEYDSHQFPTSAAVYTMHDSFNAPIMPIETNTQFQTSMDPIQIQNSIDLIKHDNGTLTTTPSPADTPIPSPVLSGKRKTRQSATIATLPKQKKRETKDSPKEENNKDDGDDGQHGDGGTTTSRRAVTTVDQLENELAFLRDECATILIMLDSLRNAFSADVSSTGASLSTVKYNSLSATINFMVQDPGTTLFTAAAAAAAAASSTTPTLVDESSEIDKRKTMAHNPEMEREMRIAYDDLMLQVRQLEKKVERLEGKSKHVSKNNTEKHEDPIIANLKDDLHELQDLTTEGTESGEEDSNNRKKKKQHH